ncbi:uncharacterized protein M437DRAFT_63701 [Aureobasidium melanogenum CBS 110374]|uniref:Uncharacterized protein n=1 Tax=Aureobasidium melanogenum (strain CBS 110374) TaxID=1043003 RepID=A0A074W0G4_AURM1|nr:uncharacterized protein M437DRAFT_63701 [Aureobasidium melanogenum CBS 110374]KEQ65044.1 hypothetical protein M437DRAFT_63701 [Aureobasidium melanogenum CBS 110374]
MARLSGNVVEVALRRMIVAQLLSAAAVWQAGGQGRSRDACAGKTSRGCSDDEMARPVKSHAMLVAKSENAACKDQSGCTHQVRESTSFRGNVTSHEFASRAL